jgi:hypothetical protein
MNILAFLNQMNILRLDKYLGLANNARDKHKIACRFSRNLSFIFFSVDFNQNWKMGVNFMKTIHYDIS